MKGSSSKDCQDRSVAGHLNDTVTTPKSGASSVFWPGDLLPQVCKQARVLTFGYDTKITKFGTGPTNKNSVFSHGKDFLYSLGRVHEPGRPLIFIAHSLGGILVKEMLSLSFATEEVANSVIVESTAAIIFLATPHRGSPEFSALGELARSMLSSLGVQTTPAILDTLGLRTSDLERSHEAFCRLWRRFDFQVKTFQESLGLTGLDMGVLGNKVVPHESSLIGDPRENAETLQANHHQMSRFSHSQDPNYIKVIGEIERFYSAIRNARTHVQNPRMLKAVKTAEKLKWEAEGQNDHVDTPSSETGISDVVGQKELKEFMKAMPFDGMTTRREHILGPAMDTGHWLFRNQTFTRWVETDDKSQHLLFIKGKPGSGKSTLMKAAVQRMEIFFRKSGIASFFVDAGGLPLQHSISGLFRSLLCQLLPQRELCSLDMNAEKEELIWSIKDFILKPLGDWDEWRLRLLLIQTIELLSRSGKPVYILVDALDELQEEMQRRQVDFWSSLIQSPKLQSLRVCLSCRNFPHTVVTGSLELSLDVCNSDDILTYITQRLDSRIPPNEDHWRKALTEKIHSLSSGVFLWVVLVVEDILAHYYKGTSLMGLVRLVENTPIELDRLYEEVLVSTKITDPMLVGKMFQWVLAANRPLSLDEWHHILAFIRHPKTSSLGHWRRSTIYTESDYQLERLIKSLSRGLLEVTNKPEDDILAEPSSELSSVNAGAGSMDREEGASRVVRVIHRSVYDFFLQKGGFKNLGFESSNPLADCHCTIVNTCIDYLFIPELDKYVFARQRVHIASLESVSLYSDRPLESEISQMVDNQPKTRGSKQTLEGLDVLRPYKPLEAVEKWLADGAVSSYAGSITDSLGSRQSLAVASQILDDYPALLVYAITEVMRHIELADLELNPTERAQSLITRLRDEAIWERLRALQQEKRTRRCAGEWLKAIAQDRLPPALKVYDKSQSPANGPRSPRSIASFSSASSFSHQSCLSHTDTKEAKNGRDKQRQTFLGGLQHVNPDFYVE